MRLRAPKVGEREQIIVKTLTAEHVHLELDPTMFHCTTTDTENHLRTIAGVDSALHDGDYVTIALTAGTRWSRLRRPVMTALEQCFEHGVKFIGPIAY